MCTHVCACRTTRRVAGEMRCGQSCRILPLPRSHCRHGSNQSSSPEQGAVGSLGAVHLPPETARMTAPALPQGSKCLSGAAKGRGQQGSVAGDHLLPAPHTLLYQVAEITRSQKEQEDIFEETEETFLKDERSLTRIKPRLENVK